MKLKSKLRLLCLAILLSLGSNSCAWLIQPAKSIVALPPTPAIQECPAQPVVEGDVVGNTVVLPMDQAIALRDWIHTYQLCMKSNMASLQGYAEKLENRLKALSTVQ